MVAKRRMLHFRKPRSSRPGKGKRARQQRLAFTFFGVVLAAGVAVFLLSLGRVFVVITASTVPVVADFEVTIARTADAERGVFAGKLIQLDGTASVEYPIVAKEGVEVRALPPQRAEGQVTLHNKRPEAQPLVATTRLLSPNGALFRLRNGVTVPANGELGGVAVYADQPGAAGNIAPTKFTIPGLSTWLQERVWAESDTAMSGGQGGVDGEQIAVAVVREEDIELARAKATTAAEQDLQRRVSAATARTQEAHLLGTDVVLTIDGAVGEARKSVLIKAVASSQVLIVERGVLRDRMRAELEEAATVQGRALRSVSDDATNIRLVAQQPSSGQATVSVRAEGSARIAPAFESFDARRITGFSPEDVRSYLMSIPGVEQVDVRLWPFWVKEVPQNGKVKVEVREAE